ncbi:uncharacterized protein LOC124923949 isoform X4 [Impatiens glandulifera]|nr:uncharacterized protein LOC124923949 isoform X4 [Impatiens glandulifera]
MLGTVGVELTNFVNPELSWKTTTKGFRTSRKGTRIWANSVLVDARSPQRDWSSVSESEKHGVAVLGRRFADHVQHVPFKKRRLLRHSSSPPARKQSHSSLKSKLNKTQHGNVASDQCCSADLECPSRAMTLDESVVAVFSPKDVDKCLKDGKPPKSMCRKRHLDFSGIDLLAETACSSMINDIEHVKNETIEDESSTAKITDTIASMQLPKESATSVDEVDDFVEDPLAEQKPSDIQDIPSAELQKAADVYASEVINQSASVKYDRLHWDLNTVMEAWEQPFDDSILNLQNDAVSCPNGGSHSERLQKMEGSGLCGDPEHALLPLVQYPVDNFASSGPSSEIFEMRSFNNIMQSREDSSLHDDESQIKHDVYSGKVTSDDDVNHEEDFREPSHFPDIVITAETCQTVNGEHSVNKLGIMNSSCESFEQGGETQLGQAANVHLQSNKSPDKSTMSSVVSNMENGCMVVNEKMSEAQTGYESSFEDGELREENEVECEIDSLDYGDDGENEHNASNFFPPESSSPECQNMRKGISLESAVQDGIGEDMMGLTQSASSNTKQQSGRDLQLPEGCEASSGRSVATNAVSSSRLNFINNCVDESLDGKVTTFAAESIPKVSIGKKMFSHLERPSRSDVRHWKDAVYAKKTGSNHVDESRALTLEERGAASDKFSRRVNSSSLQQEDRDNKDDDCVGSSSASYWDSRNKNYYYKDGAYGGPSRTRSPGNDYIERRRTVSMRDDSRRSRRSRGGFTRRSTRNDFPSDNKEQCISPVHVRRGADLSRPNRKSRSRSRSRTRSPPAWNLLPPRERRYIGVKMERTRLPYEEDNLLPSGRFSSKKWNDDSDRISRRSPPGRMFNRSKFDEQFRSGNNDDRSGSRVSKYDSSNSFDDDRRKQYEMVHNSSSRVRRFDTNGVVKQFRYDFDDHNENRYIRRSNDRNIVREERVFRCSAARTYTSGPKFSAIPEYDEHLSPAKR